MTGFEVGDILVYIGNEFLDLRGTDLIVKVGKSRYDDTVVVAPVYNDKILYRVNINQLMTKGITYGIDIGLKESHFEMVGFTLTCECGTDKLYGPDSAEELHSTWCPKSRKGNK